MLTLKYLFQHNDLAEMILKNWNYDPESLDMFQYYRISSNAVYPFREQGEVRLLRFAPVEEKSESTLALNWSSSVIFERTIMEPWRLYLPIQEQNL
ncbi:hypothetical protein P9222_00285 [Paenibacillus amylolyticus]|nr:hypothetical protein [Paenibacillus amylolyticus]WFR65724.1 hypothetical protein P9222_00285 [Paenibacillus amylolyticus]